MITLEQTGFERQLDKIHSNSKTSSKFNQDIQQIFQKISSYVSLNAENDLRDFLYSPEGIATIIGLNATEVGVLITELLFTILFVYDIKKWVEKGEPNWLYLITDLLSIMTAGFASSVGTSMIKAGKLMTFKNLSQFFNWVKKLYPTIWSKFLTPLSNSIGNITKKITLSLDKLKKNSMTPKIISKYLETAKTYLSNLKTTIEKYLGKTTTKIGKGYGEYKTKSEIIKSAENTETGRKIIKKALPYINPLLGSDKIDPFLLDLLENPNKIDLTKYKISPIFLNNNLDYF